MLRLSRRTPAPGSAAAASGRDPSAHRPPARVVRALPALVAAALAAWTAASPGAAAAQEVGQGEFTAPDTAREDLGWSGTADLGLTITSGNSETTSLSLATGLRRQSVRHTLDLSASYLRTTSSDSTVANRGRAGADYRYFPDARFYLALHGSGSFDDPAGLELRLAPGAGAGYVVARGDGFQLSAEVGSNWIRDEYVDGSSTSSFYYALAESFSLRISETTTLEQELQYLPRTGDLSDYLLHGEATLTTRITDAIGLRVRVVDDYDATPFPGGPGAPAAEKNDLTLVTGVTVQW